MLKRLSTLNPWMAMSAMLSVAACGDSSGTSLKALTPQGDSSETGTSAECEELRKAIERPNEAICPDPNDRQGCEEKLRELLEKYAANCAPDDIGQDIPQETIKRCCECSDTTCREECANIPPRLLEGCREPPVPPPAREPVECILMRHAVDVCFLTGTCEQRCFILVDAMRQACDRPEICEDAGCGRPPPGDEAGREPCHGSTRPDGTTCDCSATGTGGNDPGCASGGTNEQGECAGERDDGTSAGGR